MATPPNLPRTVPRLPSPPQATSLQLSAERQLLQQQLAASQQEAALLRGMLASSEAEFRHALDRQREALRGDLDATRGQLQATQRAAAAAAAAVQPEPSAEPAPPPAQRQPQQEQQEQREAVVPGAGLDLDSAALHQLAACVARAETAEVRLHSLEREHGALQVRVRTHELGGRVLVGCVCAVCRQQSQGTHRTRAVHALLL